mmetsp:Transcript_4805/g.13622  ORF Transcript_4805/g.13622 Transcript_4805/m.13622 type:complete len:200 (+) Transcript_4805:527-1126(+)
MNESRGAQQDEEDDRRDGRRVEPVREPHPIHDVPPQLRDDDLGGVLERELYARRHVRRAGDGRHGDAVEGRGRHSPREEEEPARQNEEGLRQRRRPCGRRRRRRRSPPFHRGEARQGEQRRRRQRRQSGREGEAERDEVIVVPTHTLDDPRPDQGARTGTRDEDGRHGEDGPPLPQSSRHDVLRDEVQVEHYAAGHARR